jgi:hypothetical protein
MPAGLFQADWRRFVLERRGERAQHGLAHGARSVSLLVDSRYRKHGVPFQEGAIFPDRAWLVNNDQRIIGPAVDWPAAVAAGQ